MDTRLKVMIVDDDEMSQMLISSILGDSYIIHSASNGSSCLQQLPELLPDVVLLDVNMPEMDGLDVCRQIRSDEKFRHMAIIFVSASDSKDEIIAGYEAGADDYIIKPLHHDALLAKVARNASLIHQRREAALLRTGPQTEETRFTQPYARFAQELKSSTSLPAVAEKIFSVTRRASISCRIQIFMQGQFSYFSDDGLLQPIETNLLEQMRGQGLVYQFGKRTIINFEQVSLLVRNMPDDNPEYSAQLLDFLIHVVGTSDIHVHLLQQLLQQKDMKETLKSAADTLQFIHQEFSQHSSRVNQVLDSVALDFNRNLDKLQLTDSQEDFMITLIDDRMRELMELNKQAMHIEENMQDFIRNLLQKTR